MINVGVEVLSGYFSPEFSSRISLIDSVAVSFSGGVDSSAVLVGMVSLLGRSRVMAYTFRSVLHIKEEIIRGSELCSDLGVEQIILDGPEQKDPAVMENRHNRCEVCKRLRLDLLRSVCPSSHALVDGTNWDDVRDPSRLGNKVISELGIFSPLAEARLTKNSVRDMARDMGIPWWNEPATACLATRFPKDENLDSIEMSRVAEAEGALKGAGFNVRLRALKGGVVCLEFPPDESDVMLLQRRALLQALSPYGFHRTMVDIEGYRTGRAWP